ncbi:protein CLP1-like protein [Iris pallida]|uniref:Protein CLP1-like protein n=1 Tax=Iris pallida TaxID=29817 RepID=A0AAX6F914_IRIPA|nr:protein CLP1-like protein [Iris pallida]
MSSAAPPAGLVRQFKLATESELRVEVGQESPLRVRLVSGTAEIFGTELPPENWLSIPPRHKFAIFTWHGATIELEGTTEVEYVADETPMVSYVNVHAILDARRVRSKASQSSVLDSSQGPRVIVVGPTDSGKSSLCRMLLSWACKQGWKPTLWIWMLVRGPLLFLDVLLLHPLKCPLMKWKEFLLKCPLYIFMGTQLLVSVQSCIKF